MFLFFLVWRNKMLFYVSKKIVCFRKYSQMFVAHLYCKFSNIESIILLGELELGDKKIR